MLGMTQSPVSKYYLTSFATPLPLPLRLFKDPEGLGLGPLGLPLKIRPHVPLRHTGHQDRARVCRKRTDRRHCGLGLGPEAGSRVAVRGSCRGRGISEPAQANGQGSGRAGPPHLHSCRPAGLKAAPAQTQIPALPCWRRSATRVRDSGHGLQGRWGGGGGVLESWAGPARGGEA